MQAAIDLFKAYQIGPSNGTTSVNQRPEISTPQVIAVQSVTMFGGITLLETPPEPQRGSNEPVRPGLSQIIDRSIEDHLDVWTELARH